MEELWVVCGFIIICEKGYPSYKSIRDNVERDYGLCGERSFCVTEGTAQTFLLPFLLNTVNLDQATLN